MFVWGSGSFGVCLPENTFCSKKSAKKTRRAFLSHCCLTFSVGESLQVMLLGDPAIICYVELQPNAVSRGSRATCALPT